MFGIDVRKRNKAANTAARSAVQAQRHSPGRTCAGQPVSASTLAPATLSAQCGHFYDGGDVGPIRPIGPIGPIGPIRSLRSIRPADPATWLGRPTGL